MRFAAATSGARRVRQDHHRFTDGVEILAGAHRGGQYLL
jgi:hypothetical protein